MQNVSNQKPHEEHTSVLDGREFIGGLGKKKPSTLEKARNRPGAHKSCRSVLDGPACIDGLSHDRKGEN